MTIMKSPTAQLVERYHVSSALLLQVALFICLLAGHIALVWSLPYFPTQDGPSHIYNLSILKDLRSGGAVWGGMYEQHLSLVPNLGFHIIAYPLLSLFDPLVVEKLFISSYILLMSISIPFILKMIERPIFPWSFLVFPAALSYSLAMGFYSYVIALPLVMLAGGISWRFRVASLLRQCVIVTICGATIYCFHLIACAFFLLIVVMQQIFTRNGSISKRIWRTLLVLLPTALLVARYVFSSVRDPQFMSSPFSERFLGMMADLVMFTSVYFSSLQIINGILLSIALYLLIRYPVRRKYSEADNAFGCFSIALVMIYLCAPPSFGGGGYFNERIPQMLLLGLIPVVSGRQAVNDRRWLPHIIIGLAVTTFALNVYVYRQKSQLVEEYMSLLETPLTKRSIVMSYRPYGIEGSRVDVLMHAVSWYGLRHNLINAGNYEPRLSYFPVKLAPEIKKMIPDPDLVNYKPDKVDFAKYPGIVYLLLWINDKKYHQPGNFVPIATNGKLSLLRTHTD